MTVSYNVIYGFSGFGRPVSNPPAVNTVVAAQTVPLRWRLVDAAGLPVTDLPGVLVTVKGYACGLGTSADRQSEASADNSGLQNLGDGYYQFDWKTPKQYAKSCKTLRLDLAEGPGMERTALFKFVK